MPDSLENYYDQDRTIPWHDSELMRVRLPNMRTYKLAYHIDMQHGTMLELPGGQSISARDAERELGWTVTMPKAVRDFDLSAGLSSVRVKQRRAASKAKAEGL